jgi:hypothetical protein
MKKTIKEADLGVPTVYGPVEDPEEEPWQVFVDSKQSRA